MAESLGTIKGQMILDVKQALASYTSARQAHISTVTALHTGAAAMTASGAAIAGVGAVMAAGLMTAVSAAAEFEKKLDYFAAVSNSTQAEYDAVSKKALQLGADTIYSANQIADSFVELGKAGVPAADIIDGVGEAVAHLGAAADIPLDTAANIITAAVQTFGLSADQAVGVADKLAGAANSSIVDVTDLGTSLKYAGGAAKALGVPFDEVNTALALLGTYGIKGSTAGTSLRTILLGLSGTTAKAKDELKELGIVTEDGANKFYDATGSAKPLSEIFQILQDATKGLTDEQKVSALETIFQNRALAASLDLTDAGAKGFDKMSASIDKISAADVASKRLDNLSGDVEILKGNLDTLFISAGGGFQEFARGIVQGVTNIINGFIALPAGAQTTILAVIGIVGALLIIIGTVGMFAGAILNIVALVIQMGQAFTLITTALKSFKVVQIAAAAAQWLLNAAMSANPIILIIIAIAALVAGLIWFFTQTELGRTIWANFVSFLTDAWNNIVSFATSTFSTLGSFFSDLWNNIVGFFSAAIDWIVNAFLNFTPQGLIISHWSEIVSFFSTLWNNIINGIVAFVTGAIAFFAALPQNIATFFQQLPGMIGYAIGFMLGVIVNGILTIGAWLVTNVPIIINNVVTFFANLPGQIVQFFVDLYNGVINWIIQLEVNIIIWVINTYNGMMAWFASIPGAVTSFFVDLYNNVVNWMIQTAVNTIATAGNIYTGIINWIQGIPGAVGGFFSDVYNNVVNFFTNAYNQAVQIAQNIYTGISDGINGIPGLVSDIFNNVVGAVQDAISGAFNAVKDFAAGMWEGFKDGLGIHSPSYIEHAMWAITAVTETETERLAKQVRVIQGLGNGITEVGRNLGNGFGSNLSAGMADLYSQVATSKAIQTQFSMGISGSGVGAANQTALSSIDKTLQELKDRPQTINYDIPITNPVPERASTSLPTSIRKAAFVSA